MSTSNAKLTPEQRLELGQLLAAACDGLLGEEERLRLNGLLSASAEARRHYIAYMEIHGRLRLISGAIRLPVAESPGSGTAEVAAAPAPVPKAEAGGMRHKAPAALPRSSAVAGGRTKMPAWRGAAHWVATPRGALASSAAALLLIGAVTLMLTIGAQRPRVGQLSSVVAARFGAGGSSRTVPSDLRAGDRLELVGGVAEVTFDSGAHLVLQGPTTVRLESARSARLEEGTVTAHVPAPASGFRITAAGADVIDQGTEFGMSVDGSGGAEVHVFDGTVRLERPAGRRGDAAQPAALTRLVEGEAVRMQSRTAAPQSIPVNQDRFLRAVPSRPGSGAERLRVACLGDTITRGSGVRPGQDYPSVLGRLLGSGYDVRNYGVNGATMRRDGGTQYFNRREFRAATLFRPHVVIVCLGTNDGKPKEFTGEDRFRQGMRDLVAHFSGLSSRPVVYFCLPPLAVADNYGIRAETVNNTIVPLLDRAVYEDKLPLIDFFALLSGRKEFYTADNIHPNAEGYARMAQRAFQAITGAPANLAAR